MIEPVTEDVFELVHDMRFPGGVRLPTRMTVLRLPGRRLVLHSPVPIDDAAAAELAALGEVTHLIAPSRMHHLWLEPAAQRYPGAAVWDARRGDPLPADLAEHLDHATIAGAPRIAETVFFHRASRSLICSDLLFHVTAPANWRTRMVLRMMGTHGGRLAVSRFWKRATKDRAAAAASLAPVLAWDAARVIVGHGAVFEGDVRAALAAACFDRITGS
jgi:hypothetical protein